MNGFKQIDPSTINDNFIKLIGSDWMLITAGDHTSHNTMTASWGTVGYMWNRPVAMAVVRPQRYTYEFTEREQAMTLSFFDEKWRDALTYCGSHSGRDGEKIFNAGLSVTFTDSDVPAIAQARLVLECKKLYVDDMREGCFLDPSIAQKWYPSKDFHRIYMMEITAAYIKE